MRFSTSTSARARRFGYATHGDLLLDGEPAAGVDEFDVWPKPNQRHHHHPWYDCKRIAAQFELDRDQVREHLLPKYAWLGDDADDPGMLSMYEKHRIVERQVADYYYYELAPYADAGGFLEVGDRIRKTALKMYQCRTSGPVGIVDGKPIIFWDSKCSCSKLCPDEARHEAQRLFDQYADAVREHGERGGRVYKFWPTLPNYPGGRLREGMRHLCKRFRDKIVRAQKKGSNKFGHVGSLLILENPLSEDRDWNVHANGIMLTKGWLSYKNLRAAWGFDFEVRQHTDFSEKGMHNLFNEMVKYSVRTVPEKSDDKSRRHKTNAPPLIEWTPAEALEWHLASHGFRRTRSYGSLHGIPKEKRSAPKPHYWVGRVEYHSDRYRVTWRQHNLAYLAEGMLDLSRRDLDLIRGDNSTTKTRGYDSTGPP